MTHFLTKPVYNRPNKPSRKRPEWNPHAFATIPSEEALCERIKFILRKLSVEAWLPEELKQQIRTGCSRVLESQIQGTLGTVKARSLIEELASATYQYEDLTLQSSTLCQIRTIDLEMNDRLAQTNYSSLAV